MSELILRGVAAACSPSIPAAPHSPSPEIVATQQDRLANWRALKELADLT